MEKYLITNFEGKRAEIAEAKGVCILIAHDEKFDSEIASSFKNLEILQNGNDIIVIANKESLIAIASLINNEDISLWDSLFELSDRFYSKSFDYKKFRGDLGELIFISNKGGEKIVDGMSSDINVDGALFEIKTYSKQKMEIIISHQQLCEKTRKVIIPIEMSNEGKSMKELIEEINDNDSFKKYLSSTYSNLSVFDIKFNTTEFHDITDKLATPNLPNDFLSAKYKVSIINLI